MGRRLSSWISRVVLGCVSAALIVCLASAAQVAQADDAPKRTVPLANAALSSFGFLGGFVVTAVYFAEYNRILSDRMSRKSLHIGMGCFILVLQPDWRLVVCLGISVMLLQIITHTLDFKFRFARSSFDVGMFEYSLLVSTCALLGIPWYVLAPSFFADPLAMIIGSNVPSPKWCGDKTIAGSLAALVATAVCFVDSPPTVRLGAGVVVTLAEAYGGKHDNLSIGVCCILMHVASAHAHEYIVAMMEGVRA